MIRVYNDCETRWLIDLPVHGAARCAADPSAGVNCINFAVDDGPLVNVPYEECYPGSDLRGLRALAERDDTIFVAHHAQFEMTVYKRVLGLLIPPERWICTMAKLAYHGYPRGLDDGLKAIGAKHLKDVQAKSTMLRLCKTGNWITPKEDLEGYLRLYHYCGVDTSGCREIDRMVPDLPPQIQRLWVLDATINQRGVPVDTQAIANAVVMKKALSAEADQEMATITGGTVTTKGQVDKLLAFAKSQGVEMVDMTADTVTRTLAMHIPHNVRRALELRQSSALSSLAKYDSMHAQQVNGRLYGQFDFYGSHTGRWAGGDADEENKSPQLMNLARAEEPEYWADLLSATPYLLMQASRPAEKLKQASRGVVCAPEDRVLMGADLAQIEARGTGWLAECQKFLDLFTKGDPYCEYGRSLFGHEITKEDLIKRTASKASVLSMGFGGGIGAGQRSAEVYSLDLNILANIILPTATPSEQMEASRNYKYYRDKRPFKPLNEYQGMAVDIVKQRYRRDFIEIADYWDELEQAFLMGGWAKKIHVEVKPSGLRVMTLPSGRQLFYHDVVIHSDGSYSYQGRRGRKFIWKGTLMENAAQAVNFDATTFYMLLADEEIAPIVHHCHDEFTLEVPLADVGEAEKKLKEIMSRKPSWADGLPLKSDIWIGRRYGK